MSVSIAVSRVQHFVVLKSLVYQTLTKVDFPCQNSPLWLFEKVLIDFEIIQT